VSAPGRRDRFTIARRVAQDVKTPEHHRLVLPRQPGAVRRGIEVPHLAVECGGDLREVMIDHDLLDA
jgi:hypothetical protein